MPNRPTQHRPACLPGRTTAATEGRGTACARGYDRRWREARAVFLGEHPLCAACEREGRLTVATLVDHIVPHRGDMARFWNTEGWQALCVPCHAAKTAKGL